MKKLNTKVKTYALECPGYFLSEQRSQLYVRYYWRVARLKNRLGAKNGLQDQAWLGLGRRGA